MCFPGGSVIKNLPANAGEEDVGLTPESGRFPGVGNSNPLQYSCLENSMDRGAWWSIVHRAERSQTQLSTHAQIAHNIRNGNANQEESLKDNQSVKDLVAQSCMTFCDPMDCSPPRLLCAWNSPSKNTGGGISYALNIVFQKNQFKL